MIYYQPDAAVKELMLRFNDDSLKNEVVKFVDHLPKNFPNYPFAALARSIASARREDINFFDSAQQLDLSAVWLEYHEDCFSFSNIDKVGLCKMYILKGWGRNGGPKIEKCEIIKDLNSWSGKPMKEIRTEQGELLVDFHHRLHTRMFSCGNAQRLDLSLWLKRWGRAENYYRYYLSLFLCHGILFEEFDDEASSGFRESVFMPAWKNIFQTFGIAPLIVRLPWDQSLGWYPGEIHKLLCEV